MMVAPAVPKGPGAKLAFVLSRALPASFFAYVCLSFWRAFQATGKLTSLIWMLSEGLVVVLLVLRRDSSAISRRPLDWFAALGATLAVMAVRPSNVAIIPDAVGLFVQLGGVAVEASAKLALGRSFGIVAANRGIVEGGPYRLVRHPIYLGYLVTHIGFLLSNWSIRNLMTYVTAYVLQVLRIFSEERVLREDECYVQYCRRVRYRLFPGLF